ncbi:uncharacterized protein [Triticum aestivum]|uniref:uncharacterized protein n=1 Tax=Triticum aestivum TaxID=4565 RepID=UPI001D011740|nr:uncharacterized protein LOC123082015 [Triticum aestivum]
MSLIGICYAVTSPTVVSIYLCPRHSSLQPPLFFPCFSSEGASRSTDSLIPGRPGDVEVDSWPAVCGVQRKSSPERQKFFCCEAVREVRMTDLFSGIQAAMVINRVENSDQSLKDWVSDEDGSGGFTGLPGTPCFTSRLSLLKVGSVVAKFSDFKRQLVMETGFGGFLEVKAWQKINLKYSAILMDRVHVESCTINLEEQGVLELSEQKLNYVFGIPSGEFDINGEGVEPSEACTEYTRMAASFSDKGTHSLKAAENVLLGAISEASSQI